MAKIGRLIRLYESDWKFLEKSAKQLTDGNVTAVIERLVIALRQKEDPIIKKKKIS